MVDALLDDLDRYVVDEQKLVTYSWVSRQFSVSSNVAKRLLYQYSKKQGDKVEPMYYISGRPKDKPMVSQEMRVVSADALLASKAALDVITSLHVYSVQLKAPTSSSGLWQVDNEWHEEDYKQVDSAANASRDNRYAAIEFNSVRASGPVRIPGPAAPNLPPPKKKTAAQVLVSAGLSASLSRTGLTPIYRI
jgi:DNA polymerase delta subunit 3